jgi:hypothetical protein
VPCKTTLATASREAYATAEDVPSRAARDAGRYGRRVGSCQGSEGSEAASTPRAHSAGQRPAGAAGTAAHPPCGKGEQMTDAGMLRSVRCGTTSQVRDASSHPHALERQPSPCPDERTLVAWLHHGGLEAWSLHRALAALPYGRRAVRHMVLAEAPRQMDVPLSSSPRDGAHGHLARRRGDSGRGPRKARAIAGIPLEACRASDAKRPRGLQRVCRHARCARLCLSVPLHRENRSCLTHRRVAQTIH